MKAAMIIASILAFAVCVLYATFSVMLINGSLEHSFYGELTSNLLNAWLMLMFTLIGLSYSRRD